MEFLGKAADGKFQGGVFTSISSHVLHCADQINCSKKGGKIFTFIEKEKNRWLDAYPTHCV